jgi:hypothetical protein
MFCIILVFIYSITVKKNSATAVHKLHMQTTGMRTLYSDNQLQFGSLLTSDFLAKLLDVNNPLFLCSTQLSHQHFLTS